YTASASADMTRGCSGSRWASGGICPAATSLASTGDSLPGPPRATEAAATPTASPSASASPPPPILLARPPGGPADTPPQTQRIAGSGKHARRAGGRPCVLGRRQAPARRGSVRAPPCHAELPASAARLVPQIRRERCVDGHTRNCWALWQGVFCS